MLDLNTLLARATAAVEAKSGVEATKAKLRDKRLSDADREALQVKLRQWESEHDYAPEALVFRTLRWHCKCGLTHIGQGRVLLLEGHKRTPGTKKYTLATHPLREDLPRHLEWQDEVSEMCFSCSLDAGFKEIK